MQLYCLNPDIIAHHILPHSLCANTADLNNVATLDIFKNLLLLSRKDDIVILGNKTKLKETDFIATNGIIHIADSFIVPSSG